LRAATEAVRSLDGSAGYVEPLAKVLVSRPIAVLSRRPPQRCVDANGKNCHDLSAQPRYRIVGAGNDLALERPVRSLQRDAERIRPAWSRAEPSHASFALTSRLRS
jgi:hypothetical protein